MKKFFQLILIVLAFYFLRMPVNEVLAQTSCEQFDNDVKACDEHFNDCSYFTCTNRCLPKGQQTVEQVCKNGEGGSGSIDYFTPVEITSLIVKPIIVVPKDKEYNPIYIHGVYDVNLTVQKWYAQQLGGKTFKLDPTQVFYSDKTVEQLRCGSDSGNCPSEVNNFWGSGHQELGRFMKSGVVVESWLLGGRLTALGWGGGSLASGFTMLGDVNLDAALELYPYGPTGADCAMMGGEDYCNQNAQAGTLAHELGHAMNLDSWGDSNWHAVGTEARYSVMGDPFKFPDIGLLDTPLNPEKSSLLKRSLPQNQNENIKPRIDRITPSEGSYNDKIEIFGANFGKAEDKNVVLFGENNQLAPSTRGNLGQTVEWSDNHIIAWIFKPFSTDIRILTKNGLSNPIFITVKEQAPETKYIAGVVTCPGVGTQGRGGGEGADAVIINLNKTTDIGEEELTSVVANQNGRWSINYPMPKDENVKYNLQFKHPKSKELLDFDKSFDYFHLDNQGRIVFFINGSELPNDDIHTSLKDCPHLDITKAQLTINGQKDQYYLDSKDPIKIGVVISNKDDPENLCIAGLKSEDIKFEWIRIGKLGKNIPVETTEPIQNCQSVNALPPKEAGTYGLTAFFQGSELFQTSRDIIYVKLNPSKIKSTINGKESAEATIGEKVNVGVQISPLNGEGCVDGIEANSVSLVWTGENQHIPITIDDIQNCQSYSVSVPDIGGRFLLKASFLGDPNLADSFSTAQLTVKKLPVKILTQVNGSTNFTPTTNEPVNVGIRITPLDSDVCFADLDNSRIYLAWVSSSNEAVPIAAEPHNCQPMPSIPLPSKAGEWRLKASFAGDQKYDTAASDQNSEATLNVSNPQALTPFTAVQGAVGSLTGNEDDQALSSRIITEIKVDDRGVDPSNPGDVLVNLAEHGCQIDKDCDYPVRIAVSYSVGNPDYFTLNLHYKAKVPTTTNCPNWRRIDNRCVGNGVADLWEEDTCDPSQTRMIASGVEDASCQ